MTMFQLFGLRPELLESFNEQPWKAARCLEHDTFERVWSTLVLVYLLSKYTCASLTC